jgi:hypothetical protein
MSTMTADTGADEFDGYLAEQMLDPGFARWWHWISATLPNKLPINGREYARRQKKRRGGKR